MKATELQIVSFLQSPNVQFVIPIYQRNYDWTITECRELFQDIIQVSAEERPSHFIGSIVFIHDGVLIFKVDSSKVDSSKELSLDNSHQRLSKEALFEKIVGVFKEEFKTIQEIVLEINRITSYLKNKIFPEMIECGLIERLHRNTTQPHGAYKAAK